MIFLLLLVGTTVAVPILPAIEAEVEDGIIEEIISTGLQFEGPIISSILFKRAFDPTYVDPPVPDILSLISLLEKRQDIQVEDGLLEDISTGLQFIGPIISSILFKRNPDLDAAILSLADLLILDPDMDLDHPKIYPLLPQLQKRQDVMVEDGLLEEISTGLQFIGPIISSILFKRNIDPDVTKILQIIGPILSQLQKRQDVMVEDGLLEEISTGLQFVIPIISSILFKRNVEDGLLEDISTGLQFIGPIISSILFKRDVEDGLLEDISTGLQFIGPIISSILFKRDLDIAEARKLLELIQY